MNQIFLSGRLTKDPEIREGTTMTATFSIASNRYVSGNEEVEYYDIVAFGKTAERVSKALKQGYKINLTHAFLRPNNYEKNGVKVRSYNIVMTDFEITEYPDKKNEEQP